jgi:glycosyltransferase involved in cell wall biosynthesis/SAM-dependent methyltransferase
MDAAADPRLGFQPDIYQRYGFLERLIEVVFGTPGDPQDGEASSSARSRLLDVGAGPARLVEAFGPAWLEVVRTDVTTFGDSSIIQMAPDGSLPFPDRSFDIVLAMDVLEHVPEDRRASLVGECQRVAARALILGGPVDSREVVAAERAFAEFARTVSGRELAFLAEHAQFGLPKRDHLIGSLDGAWHVVTVENAPLAEWQLFNAIDFLYASDVGDGEPKRATNAIINSQSFFRRESGPHYRTFVCAFRDDGDAAAMREFVVSPAVVGPPLASLEIASKATDLLPRLQLDLRNVRQALEAVISAKAAHVAGFDRDLDGIRALIAEKDDHIGKVTNVIHQLQREASEKDTEIATLRSQAKDLDALAASLQGRIKALQGVSNQRLNDIRRLEQDLAARSSLAARLAREAEDLQAALSAIRSSISWKVSRPARVIARSLRALVRSSPGVPPAEPPSVSEAPADPHQFEHSVIASSPLFDRQWYQGRAPEVSEADDLVMHYLTQGRRRGLDPHPLFDTAFYLDANPDVAAAAIDPLAHYISCGALEGRRPHPLFDNAFYLEENADVAAARIDALAHYVTQGAKEARRPHPLFDSAFYLAQNPEVSASGLDPLTHYITRGAHEGLDPHPLFDTTFYLEENPEIAAAGANPLAHFVLSGARQGRNPHPLFDTSFYLAQNADVAATGINPLVDFVVNGAREGRDPHPLFDSSFYLEQNADVAAAGINPLVHYVTCGAAERRTPHRYFDVAFYLERNPDVAASGMNPLVHYLALGAREGRDPHRAFDTSFYLEQNPDVAAAGLNPLVHYVTCGAREGRRSSRPAHPVQADPRYAPPEGLIPWFNPLTIAVSDVLSSSPRLNVLLPGLAMKHMSGGPNTAIALGSALAARGVGIRFVSTDAPVDNDSAPFWDHVKTLTRAHRLPPNMELVDAHDRSRPISIGANDLFMATAWWTAQQVKYAIRETHQKTFLYLIQDYEPLLHAASSQYALASETYELPHVPIINTSLLRDFLASQKIGRFRDEAFARAALVFEPALDQSIFHPHEMPRPYQRRRLLFYARPTNGLRNLFELGVAALQKVIDEGVLDPELWEFVGMGEQFAPVALGRGAVLRPAEWVNLEGYARQMRQSDVLLSLMLSPHPSYPPLEMAASGGVSVTTTFGTKTAERLSQLSRNIIGVEPTIESIAAGLDAAVRRLPLQNERLQDAHLALPQNWSDSFDPILPQLMDELALLQGSPSLPAHVRLTAGRSNASKVFPGFRGWAGNEYDLHRRASIISRQEHYPVSEPGSISLLTPVWNTDPAQLEELAQSVLGQDAGTGFEWIVVDNGTTRGDTRACLARLAEHPAVRLHRSDQNVGIIAGSRLCLERASNPYVVPVDHDDLLTPDAVRVLSHALERAGYPAFAYSDEDKLEGHSLRDPYFKPDWDPVLFVNSCYTSHLCAINRGIALELEAYTDQEVEGSPDWDTFTRLYVAGHVPLHIPEVLYSWRMHAESTAGNIHSKPYVFAAHRKVLGRVLAAATDAANYDLQPSPLFSGTPDWWIRRAHRDPWPITTVIVTAHDVEMPVDLLRSDFPHEVLRIHSSEGPARLQEIAVRCAESGRLVHLLWSGTMIDEQEWPWEAMTHFELFPDTVMIGGRVHDGRRIRMAGRYFGFGSGCDSPDRGRLLDDPGYFAQMWKQHSVSAISIQHCVVRAEFLREALGSLTTTGIALAGLGPWLGAAAMKAGRRVVYSPFFSASTGIDVDDEVSEVERAAFRSAHRELIPEVRYLSPSLGLSPSTAYRPATEEIRHAELDAASTLPSYADWTTAEAMARAVAYVDAVDHPTFSFLTTLYSGTQADLLRQTARSLFEQTRPFAEWVILIHGPVPPAVEGAVSEWAADARVRVLRKDENVGIVGGLKLCLQEASSEYVVPMDADDTLTTDALQVLGAEIRSSHPDLIYSDEDTLREGIAESPFFRPDFDRVLNAENSYVWHLCAFRRDEALRLGVYTDANAEFCHDWDTICRFTRGGGQVTHANHVLYHWRAHTASHSNSGGQHPGSLASTKFILHRTIDEQAYPSLYRVVPFPIFRGAEEWCIQRLPVHPPSVDLVVLGTSRTSAVVQECGFPFQAVHDHETDGAEWSTRLLKALDTGSEFIVVVGDDCEGLDQSGIWEAVKQFEMHPDVAVVSGRILNARDVVVASGNVPDNLGRLLSPFEGLEKTDPGPFAMALKAHCILCPADGLFVARSAFLARALERLPPGLDLTSLGCWLGANAIAGRMKIAYSPLLQGRTRDQAPRAREGSHREIRRFLDHLGVQSAEQLRRVMGIAGFLNARRIIGATPPNRTDVRAEERGERLEPVRG